MAGGSNGGDRGNEEGPVAYRVVGFDELEGNAAAHYRRQRRRRLLLFITLPGLVLGTATVATAYSTGLVGSPEKVCVAEKKQAPERGSFEIELLNSADTLQGAAGRVNDKLLMRGFKVASVGNADSSVYVKGPATIYYGPDGLENALLLQKQIPGAKIWNDHRAGEDVQLVLGYGFEEPGLIEEPPPPLPAPEEISLNVYNTTFRAGLAGDTADELKSRDFTIKKVGNDPRQSFHEDDVAIIRFGPDGERRAERLAQQIDGAQLQKDDRTTKTVSLVLGSEFDGLKPDWKVPDVKPYERPPETIRIPCEEQE